MIQVIAHASYSNGQFKTFRKDVMTLSSDEETLCMQVAMANENSLESLRTTNLDLYRKLRTLCIGRAKRYAADSSSVAFRRYGMVSDSIYGGVIARRMNETTHIVLKMNIQ